MEHLLKEILTQTTADPTFNPLVVEYSGQTLFTHQQIFDQFAYNYSSYTVIVSSVYQPTVAFFVNLWQAYVNETAAQLSRELAAMAAEYDPVSNYDMTERSIDGRKQGKQTDTTTPTGGTHTVTQLKRAGLNSTGDGANADKTETDVTPLQGSKTETERTYTNDQTATIDNETVSGNDVNEHLLRRSGNIGVTTASQMITDDVRMRQTISLLRDYVHAFVVRYCFSVGGD